MVIEESSLDKVILLINNLSNEKLKRILLAASADMIGYGGQSYVKNRTGTALSTLRAGIKESQNADTLKSDRIRKEGGGRKSYTEHHPEVKEQIEQIIDGNTYGSPQKSLHWISENLSLRKIAEILKEKFNLVISHVKVGQILEELGYSKQSNQKMLQLGVPSPNRDEQFSFINEKASECINKGIPVISVDTKKKENIGNFKQNGSEYRKKGDPRKVLDHDFPIKELGKVNPYGIYVLNDNTGFINLGTSSDTAEFAVESIRRWWYALGKKNFPDAEMLYITCDSGGSNGARNKCWKGDLQVLSDEINISIMVSHFPPGTSKWNKIEHRMFCYISKNWEGKPLIDIETVVDLITNTKTKKGLKIDCQIDRNTYEKGRTMTDDELKSLNIVPCDKFENWNYIIKPRS